VISREPPTEQEPSGGTVGKSKRPATVRFALWLAVLLALLVTASGASALEPPPQSSPGTAEEAQRLLSIIQPIGAFRPAMVRREGYTFELRGPNGDRVGDLIVGLRDHDPELTRIHSRRFAVAISNSSYDFSAVDVLVPAARAIVASDGGALPATGIVMRKGEHEQMMYATLWVVIAGILAGILKRGKISWEVRKVHLIQACAHTSIFVYWSFYWPAVHGQVPMILMMLVMAFGADAAFCFAKFGSWRVGFSPLPVVFSTNLFVWLDWRGATIAMIGAFAFKTFVRRGQGHIFNPSVAGLTLNAICTVVFPDVVHFGGLFHTLNIAPNMSEWVFLVSLVPLTVFRLLPVSIGCVIGLFFISGVPGAIRPTLLLMMTLLATDPATTPRSDIGRIFFGLLVGLSYQVYSDLLHSLGQPDDFAKILSVPLANVLVPWFDKVAARPTTAVAELWKAKVTTPRPAVAAQTGRIKNGVFFATWVVLYTIALGIEKPEDFEPALHWTWGTPLVARDASDVPRCSNNPIFCRPFSQIQEIRAWAAR